VRARKNAQVVEQIEPVGEIVDAELQRYRVRGIPSAIVPGREIEQGPRLDAPRLKSNSRSTRATRSGKSIPRIAAGVGFQPGAHQAADPVQSRGRVRIAEGILAPVSLQFGVNNLTDRLYLFNYLKHFFRARTSAGRVSSRADHIPPARTLRRQKTSARTTNCPRKLVELSFLAARGAAGRRSQRVRNSSFQGGS